MIVIPFRNQTRFSIGTEHILYVGELQNMSKGEQIPVGHLSKKSSTDLDHFVMQHFLTKEGLIHGAAKKA